MNDYSVLARAYAQTIARDRAFSALPHAPVVPHVEPRHRLRRVATAISRPFRYVRAVRPSRRRNVQARPLTAGVRRQARIME